MEIEFGAFKNCVSLKEILFKNQKDAVFTHIADSNRLPKDFVIVVPDDLLQKQLNIELPSNKKHVVSVTEYQLIKLKRQLNCNFNTYVAIWHLRKVKNFKTIQCIEQYLVKKYDIDEKMMQQLSTCLDVLKKFDIDDV